MFSIIIPSFNNLNYLKLCIDSIKKNSSFNHEIIIHVNEGVDGTLEYVKKNNFSHSYTKNNIGLCSGTNLAASKSSTDYILYTHDDMYFCPNWDVVLKDELSKIDTHLYYLSGTMIEKDGGHIKLNCGSDYSDFNEEKLIVENKKLNFADHQGTHWAPHLINKKIWDKVGGFSEEFNPGIGSDPDLNMKLWKIGVRIFKGLGSFRVYHFGSISLRKKDTLKRNKGSKTFLKKWGISPTFFVKHYLKGAKFENNQIICNLFDGPLKNPKKTPFYLFGLFLCKLKLIYYNIFKI